MKHAIVVAADKLVTDMGNAEDSFGKAVKAAIAAKDVAAEAKALREYATTYRKKHRDAVTGVWAPKKQWPYVLIGKAAWLLEHAAEGNNVIFNGKSLRDWYDFNKGDTGPKDKTAPRNPLAKFDGSPKQLAAFVLAHFEGDAKGLAAFRKAMSAE